MTPAQLKQIRKALGYSQTKMAEVMGYKGYLSIQMKEDGTTNITKQDTKFLKVLCLLHDIELN
jgi:transcriptional regulator with XRE-family HTH domain